MRRQDPHEIPDLLKRYATLESRVRTLELRAIPPPAVGGGAWCELDTNDWIDGSGVGFTAVANLDSIDDQSGGFAVVDSQTISVPEGLYEVEWAFKFTFLLQNPWTDYMVASDFTDTDWTLWRAGPCAATNSVFETTVYGKRHLDPITFQDYGGGDGGMLTGEGNNGDLFVWRSTIHAWSPNHLNLSLGILDFNKVFAKVPDYTPGVPFTPFIQDPSLGSGSHSVRIASIG